MPRDEVDVSVVMPARNAEQTISQQLAALAEQDFTGMWEVVVVDNGSSDRTRQMVDEFQSRVPRLRVLTCVKVGANAARNAGIREARGRLILFCDADDVAARDWVRQMHAALADADCVAGAIDDISLNAQEVRTGAPRRLGTLQTVAGFLPRGITANLGGRADVIRAVGGFDEEYRFGATDTEFCWRVQLAGYSLREAPSAVMSWRRADDTRTIARKAFLTGRARARLFRDFKSAGMPRSSLLRAFFTWGQLLLSAPVCLLGGRRRREWVRSCAAARGRLMGSLRFRVVYL